MYDNDSDSSISPHALAVFYMVLALGMLVDLDRPAHNPECTQLYQLGRAALAITSVLEEPSIPAIQALVSVSHIMSRNHLNDSAAINVPLYVLERH
jgi:hypothetical protein